MHIVGFQLKNRKNIFESKVIIIKFLFDKHIFRLKYTFNLQLKTNHALNVQILSPIDKRKRKG